MTAREQWGLRGPVRTCQIQRTWLARRCGADVCETEETRSSTDLEFHRDDALLLQSHLNPDGSRWTIEYEYQYNSGRLTTIRHIRENALAVNVIHEYDDQGRLRRVSEHSPPGPGRTTEEYDYDLAGRKKKTQYMDIANQRPDTHYSYGVEGSDAHYSAPGTAKLITIYNERDQPLELLFYEASDRFLSRVAFAYDADGHLIEESQTRPPEAFATLFRDVPPDQLDAMRAAVQGLCEPTRITHRYDQRRRVESRTHFGLLSEEIKTRSYNEHGDQVAETSEQHSREYGPDGEGQLAPVHDSERGSRSEARFHYEYDEFGNWTSKIIETRSGAEQDFTASTIEKRLIQYF